MKTALQALGASSSCPTASSAFWTLTPIAAKEAVGREHDLAAVKQLRAIKRNWHASDWTNHRTVHLINSLSTTDIHMSILVTPQTRVLVQGITGSFGARHTQLSLAYGTQVVAGVTPGKGGQLFESKVPIFDTVAEAMKQTGATASAIFVPPAFAADAILEGVDAGLDLVVCITEGIPVNDMVKVKRAMEGKQTRLIGPNCPGHRDARRRQGFAGRLPHRHCARLHPQARPHRRGLPQRHVDL